MKKIIAFTLGIVMMLSLTLTASALPMSKSNLSDEIYEEVNYSFGSNAFSIIEDAETRSYFEETIADNDLVLQEIQTRSVYILENVVDNRVVSGHPMTVAEVARYNNLQQGKLLSARATNSLSDSDTMAQLTITLSRATNSRQQQTINFSATWDNTHLASDGYYYPAAGLDTIGISWGGNGGLIAVQSLCSGAYTNGNTMTCNAATRDSYSAYSWQFLDRPGGIFGNVMSYARGFVTLGLANGTPQGRQTNVKMSYVHTYTDSSTSFSISWSQNGGFAASLVFTGHESHWSFPLELMSVPY